MKQATTDYRTKTTPIVYHTVYKKARVFRLFLLKKFSQRLHKVKNRTFFKINDILFSWCFFALMFFFKLKKLFFLTTCRFCFNGRGWGRFFSRSDVLMVFLIAYDSDQKNKANQYDQRD
ncbi:hypothetical protein CYQ76_05160 [Enterococcus faecium]|nr:hypothetical protein CYQ76_05160 [Enterococcus faecium]